MENIERLKLVREFNPALSTSLTRRYETLQGDISSLAGRVSKLVSNMGIEGEASLAIDGAIGALVSQLQVRSDNIGQLAEARSAAESSAESAIPQAVAIGMAAKVADTLIGPGVTMKAGLEISAAQVLATISAQTDDAIAKLPTIFPQAQAPSTIGGAVATHVGTAIPGGSEASGYSPKVTNSATAWVPQANPSREATMGASSRVALSADPGDFAGLNNPGFAGTGAVLTGNDSGVATPGGSVEAGSGALSASSGVAGGIVKASVGAAMLPSMARGLAGATSAMLGTARTGGGTAGLGVTPRGGQTSPSRAGAAPRTGQSASPRTGTSARSGATTRTSSGSGAGARSGQGSAGRAGTAARSGVSARSGQGAATRAGTSSSGATGRGLNGGSGAKAAGGTTAKRGVTGQGKSTSPSVGQPAKNSGRGGVTAPRKSETPQSTNRGTMGRAVSERGGKKNKQKQGIESYSAAETRDESTITFIESGQREA